MIGPDAVQEYDGIQTGEPRAGDDKAVELQEMGGRRDGLGRHVIEALVLRDFHTQKYIVDLAEELGGLE